MDIIIIGAGLTGLSAGISLRRSGHRVTIYERSSFHNEVGAAINVPPNVTRFLLPWGLDPIRSRFVSPTALYFMSPMTMEDLGDFDYSHNTELYGAPLYYAHRVDLHESLKRIATGTDGPGIPVKIHLKSGVVKYNVETPSVLLLDGSEITGDLIIAADGVHSTAVEAMLGETESPQPGNGSNCCYRFLIPRTELEDDPDTKFFNSGHQQLGCRVFPDSPGSRKLVAYQCRNYEIHNFVAICNRDDMISKREDWRAAVDKTELLEKFAGFHPSLLAVMNKATEVKRWPLLYRPPVRSWYKGRTVLAGDAAHPMLPHHAQAGAQGIEDGLALGLVLLGVTKNSQIEERLAIYEKIRRNRASSIQILSNNGFREPPEGLADFLDGQPAPVTLVDTMRMAFAHDVVQRTTELMKEFEPTFKIPHGFFQETPASSMNGNGGIPATLEWLQVKWQTLQQTLWWNKQS